ncbi:MAG: radical SAM protein [Candidatus Helarchaeota archaeon]|nr:radical SAM protein [Candidatus Helarchaeota archaeon]
MYCYAEFMIRFTGHKGEKWGQFLDIKTFNLNQIKPQKYNGKRILLSSVTDPYTPLEKKYQNTRKILERLIGTNAEVSILTKSKLVVRDIDLFQQFTNIAVGISISTLDENFARKIERAASTPLERLEALRKISEAGIQTYTFISPFFPEITDFKAIVEEAVDYTNYFMFENLNFRPHNIPRIMRMIKENYPKLITKYKEFQRDPSLWDIIQVEIENYCEKRNLTYSIEFHHGGFSKS